MRLLPPRDGWPDECDYLLNEYYLDERRFFASTGADSPETSDQYIAASYEQSSLGSRACEAARSARFEHGESG